MSHRGGTLFFVPKRFVASTSLLPLRSAANLEFLLLQEPTSHPLIFPDFGLLLLEKLPQVREDEGLDVRRAVFVRPSPSTRLVSRPFADHPPFPISSSSVDWNGVGLLSPLDRLFLRVANLRPVSFFVQTIDFSPFLSISPAMDFRAWLGGEKAITTYCHDLALK